MWMKMSALLGITGVEAGERSIAVQWAKRLEWPILLVALWIPIQWYLEETGAVPYALSHYFDWFIWAVFLAETVLLTTLVRDKKRYLANNWMNLVIIMGGMPLAGGYTPLVGVLRNLRLVLMLFMLVRVSRRLRGYLSGGHIGSMLVIIGIVVVLAGIIVTRLDPSIGTVWDGMWWAWVTVTHTGYGDVVPRNGSGRFFGALVILLGVVLISLLTASLSALMIGGEVKKVEREVEKDERESEVSLHELRDRLDRIERMLEEQRKRQG